jgi:FdhD protein
MSLQRQEQPVREVAIAAMRDERLTARQDLVVVEEPLEIRIAQAGDSGPGTSVSITMRTPGEDVELAVGFLHGEGIIRSREDIADTRICGPVGNVVRIQLAESAAHDPARLQRNFYTTSSCGVCGNASLAAVERMLRSPSVDASLTVPAALIESLSERARAGQDVFRETGGLHASCLFDADGTLIALREDVGRHNALDKLIGALARQGIDAGTGAIVLTSRVSVEMVQKTAMARCGTLIAVSAPTAHALRLAAGAGITLAAYARAEGFDLFSNPHRLSNEVADVA